MMPLRVGNFPCCERKKGFQRRSWKPFVFLVGAAGFELATPCTPCVSVFEIFNRINILALYAFAKN